jgi:putative SOS response-associated peptidase YedK
MCGRFVITSPPAALRLMFGYEEQPNFPPRHNIAPTQPVPVVIVAHGRRHFRLMRWGLIPSWVKDPRKITLMINARSEGIAEKPAFKNAIRRRRCLIPADGYYEWQVVGGRKRPFFIFRADRRPFALAGLAESWVGPNGEELDTVAIVTTAASRDLAVLHHRAPVAIREADIARWLDCTSDSADPAMGLLAPPEVGEFAWHEVSIRVNHADNDDPQLILPVTEEQRAAEAAPKQARRAGPRKTPPPAIDDGQGSLF